MGIGEQGHLFQGNGEQMPNFEGNKGTKTICGNMEHRKQFYDCLGQGNKPIEACHEKTNIFHMQKQRRRSASQFLNPKFQASN